MRAAPAWSKASGLIPPLPVPLRARFLFSLRPGGTCTCFGAAHFAFVSRFVKSKSEADRRRYSVRRPHDVVLASVIRRKHCCKRSGISNVSLPLCLFGAQQMSPKLKVCGPINTHGTSVSATPAVPAPRHSTRADASRRDRQCRAMSTSPSYRPATACVLVEEGLPY